MVPGMRSIPTLYRILVLALALLALLATRAGAAPSIGDAAPDFVLQGTDGALYPLSDHLGKRGVVLAWFPKAFTPG
jgi:peroxiredoxin Q/BCP